MCPYYSNTMAFIWKGNLAFFVIKSQLPCGCVYIDQNIVTITIILLQYCFRHILLHIYTMGNIFDKCFTQVIMTNWTLPGSTHFRSYHVWTKDSGVSRWGSACWSCHLAADGETCSFTRFNLKSLPPHSMSIFGIVKLLDGVLL